MNSPILRYDDRLISAKRGFRTRIAMGICISMEEHNDTAVNICIIPHNIPICFFFALANCDYITFVEWHNKSSNIRRVCSYIPEQSIGTYPYRSTPGQSAVLSCSLHIQSYCGPHYQNASQWLYIRYAICCIFVGSLPTDFTHLLQRYDHPNIHETTTKIVHLLWDVLSVMEFLVTRRPQHIVMN